MKRVLQLSWVVFLAAGLLLPPVVSAEEDDFEKDAVYAEGNPPVIPHKVEVGATGDYCLSCHLEGKNGAPPAPHAVRRNCTQCHVQGEIREKKGKKKTGVKKSRQPEAQ